MRFKVFVLRSAKVVPLLLLAGVLFISCSLTISTPPVLKLSLTYTASSSTFDGSFITDYTITNQGNVPITITGGTSVFYGSLGAALTDIVKTNDTLLSGTTLSPGSSVAEQRDGYSINYVPYSFDYSFSYNDGNGNGKTTTFTDGVFTVH